MLLGIAPFGIITGVAMVASGIAPWAAMLMSIVVFAGASMVASAQLLASGSPVLVVILATLFINLRFMLYSAGLRQHFAGAPLRWRLLISYLLADNVYAITLGRSERVPMEYFLGSGGLIWLAWQLSVLAGVVAGAGLPASWRLEFAAPLAFIALSVPFLRDRATIAAAVSAGAVVVATHALPFRLSIVAAALTGIAVGMLLERKPPA